MALLGKTPAQEEEGSWTLPCTEERLRSFPLFSSRQAPELAGQGPHHSYCPGVPVVQLGLRAFTVAALRHAGIGDVRALLRCTPEDLLQVRNIGAETVKEVQARVAELILGTNALLPQSAVPPEKSGSFPEMVRSFLRSALKDERMAIILEGRLAPAGGRRVTLQKLGDRYGVTRERIRQIEEQARRRIAQPRCLALLGAFWRRVEPLVAQCARRSSPQDLGQLVGQEFGWSPPPTTAAARAFLALNPDFPASR